MATKFQVLYQRFFKVAFVIALHPAGFAIECSGKSSAKK
jgi:hypothetical protein